MLVSLNFPPGLYANGTVQQAAGRWYDANLVRFFEGTIRPWGGWTDHISVALTGKPRCMLAWTDNDGLKWIAAATEANLYITNRVGTLYNVTPFRRTQARTDPISTTNLDATVTIADASHGAAVGDYVRVSGASAVGGITVDGWYQITVVPDTDTIQFEHSSAATSTAGPGGGSVTLDYRIKAGEAEAAIGGGYGSGNYGAGNYGESSGDPELVTPAMAWTMDTYGHFLVACNDFTGGIYRWGNPTDGNDTAVEAEIIPNAPTSCAAVFVTEYGHVVALGADGDPRQVDWSHAQDWEIWTPSSTVEAGTFPLQTGGNIMCGTKIRGGGLVLTDQDAWLMRYSPGTNPFGFEQVGKECGAIGRHAMATAGTNLVAWMGQSSFWRYDGSVQPIPCPVSDRVFGDISTTFLSHVTAYNRQEFGEIIWHYPSASATENDKYVAWNYRESHWTTGSLERTCGIDEGSFSYPLACDSSGMMYRHEVGFAYDGATPYVESGPFQIGVEGEAPGSNVYSAVALIPDESTLGNVEATFYCRFRSTGSETTVGPYTAGQRTAVRFTTRHARMRLTGDVATDWRIGTYQLDIEIGGKR